MVPAKLGFFAKYLPLCLIEIRTRVKCILGRYYDDLLITQNMHKGAMNILRLNLTDILLQLLQELCKQLKGGQEWKERRYRKEEIPQAR